MSDWRPIETAPKDGMEILIAGESELLPGEWLQFVQVSAWQDGTWDGYGRSEYRVTHWMPKPDPPPRESSVSHRPK